MNEQRASEKPTQAHGRDGPAETSTPLRIETRDGAAVEPEGEPRTLPSYLRDMTILHRPRRASVEVETDRGGAIYPWPRLPQFSLVRMLERIRRITRKVHVEGGMLGRMLDPQGVQDYVLLARKALNLPASRRQAVNDAVFPFAEQRVEGEVARRLAICLAGNYSYMKEGTFGSAIVGSDGEYWEPLRFVELRFSAIRPPTRRRGARLYLNVKVDRLTGRKAGTVSSFVLPHRMLVRHYSRILAYGVRDDVPDHPELAGMVFYGRLRCRDRSERLTEVWCPTSYRDYNRKLRRRRAEPCPRGYRRPCHVCHIGLDGCDRAAHLRTWDLRPCPKCGNPNAPFDPEWPDAHECLVCETELPREKAHLERTYSRNG